MVARTYYRTEPEPTFAHPCRLHRCADRMHGHTLEDVDRAARIAVSTRLHFAADRAELHQAAWDGVVDRLISAEGHPTFRDLVRAGEFAIDNTQSDWRHHHGHGPRGTGTRPGFLRYWTTVTATSVHEDRIVEFTALTQVWWALTDQQRAVLTALATAGTLTAAAEVADLSAAHLKALVRRARARAAELWHEHETPQPPTRFVRRGRAHAPCGTSAGYAACRRRHGRACESCRAARRAA